METIHIDINCDVGEGVGNEADLFPLISSCSVACGGHAGNQQSMTKMVRLGKKHQVKMGAHPSYPDRTNFGRTSMKISEASLITSVAEQILNFVQVLEDENMPMNHIKPHGALYNDITKDSNLAKVFLQAVEPYKTKSLLYVPFGSVVAKEAKQQGFSITYEGFGDRNYNDDLSLVSRKLPNALITEPKVVLEHIVRMAREKKVRSITARNIPMKADTFCIHGDTHTALQILMYLNQELPNQKVQLEK